MHLTSQLLQLKLLICLGSVSRRHTMLNVSVGHIDNLNYVTSYATFIGVWEALYFGKHIPHVIKVWTIWW